MKVLNTRLNIETYHHLYTFFAVNYEDAVKKVQKLRAPPAIYNIRRLLERPIPVLTPSHRTEAPEHSDHTPILTDSEPMELSSEAEATVEVGIEPPSEPPTTAVNDTDGTNSLANSEFEPVEVADSVTPIQQTNKGKFIESNSVKTGSTNQSVLDAKKSVIEVASELAAAVSVNLKNVSQQRFGSKSAVSGSSDTATLNIPAGCSSWSDSEATRQQELQNELVARSVARSYSSQSQRIVPVRHSNPNSDPIEHSIEHSPDIKTDMVPLYEIPSGNSSEIASVLEEPVEDPVEDPIVFTDTSNFPQPMAATERGLIKRENDVISGNMAFNETVCIFCYVIRLFKFFSLFLAWLR